MSLNISREILANNNRKESWAPFKRIYDMLYPNFGHLPILTKWIINDPNHINDLCEYWSLYKENKQFFKNSNMNLNTYSSIEEWGDNLRSLMKQQDLKNLINTHFSNKYKVLINDEVKKLLSLIIENGMGDAESIRKVLVSKLAAYKSSDDLIIALEKIIESKQSNYDIEYIKQKTNKTLGLITYEKDNLLIIEALDHSCVKRLGSNNWCITRSKSMFNSYASRDRRQFIIFDFNYKYGERNHIIGLTTYMNGSYYTSFDYMNNYIRDSSLSKLFKHIKPLSKEEVKQRTLSLFKSGVNMNLNSLIQYGISLDEVIDNTSGRKSSNWWDFKTTWFSNYSVFLRIIKENKIFFTYSDYLKLNSRKYSRACDLQKRKVKESYLELMKPFFEYYSTNPLVSYKAPKELYDPSKWKISNKHVDYNKQFEIIKFFLNEILKKNANKDEYFNRISDIENLLSEPFKIMLYLSLEDVKSIKMIKEYGGLSKFNNIEVGYLNKLHIKYNVFKFRKSNPDLFILSHFYDFYNHTLSLYDHNFLVFHRMKSGKLTKKVDLNKMSPNQYVPYNLRCSNSNINYNEIINYQDKHIDIKWLKYIKYNQIIESNIWNFYNIGDLEEVLRKKILSKKAIISYITSYYGTKKFKINNNLFELLLKLNLSDREKKILDNKIKKYENL